ncbi:hypothetical protein Tco_1077060 [Tanacetum coccineum]
MFDIDYLTDSMNSIPVSLENQTNPHAGTSKVTNSAGTLPTPNVNASEEEDAAEELIVVPTTVKHTTAKFGPRMYSTNLKAEEFFTELQNLKTQEKEAYSSGISEDTHEILAFRKELDELAQKHLRDVPKNKATSTNSVNSGSGRDNTQPADQDDSDMPELAIFNKPQKGIFDEAYYDDEGMVYDFNNLPTEVAVSPIPTLRIHNIQPQSQILGNPKSYVQTRSRVQQHSGAHALEEPKKISNALKDDSWVEVVLKRRHVVLTNSEEGDAENSSKQGRNLEEEGLDEMVRSIMKEKSEEFETPTQGKTSEEADISPKGLEAAETLAKVLTQRTKTYTRKVKPGLRRKLDADEVSTGEGINTGFIDFNTAFEEINFGDESIIPSPKKGQREGKALKKLRPDELKEEFDKCVVKVEKFIPMNSELEASKLKRTSINLQGKVFKKQKITDVPDVTKDESVKREEEFKVQRPILRYNVRKSLARKGLQKNKSEYARSDTKEDVEAYMDERVDEPSSEEFQMGLIPQGSAPAKIVKWQILKTSLLNDLTRDDLKELYRQMMLKYGDSRPEEEYERVLWGDLKTMFDPPSTKDVVWSLTHQQKVLSWRYFHSCAVYYLTLEVAHIYMLTEVKYPLPSRVCQAMLEKKLIRDRKDEVCYQLLQLIERKAQQQ